MNKHKMLELLAIDCHHVGSTWAAFWAEHGERVRKAEPWNIQRYRRLVRHLLALVTSGDCDGMEPIANGVLWADAAPWLADEAMEAAS